MSQIHNFNGHRTLHILSLGDLGFPFGLASIQKLLLVCKGLYQYGVQTTVINRYGFHKKSSGLTIKKNDSFDKIRYVYASGYPYKPNSFIVRNALKIWGLINEIFILIKLRNINRLDIAMLRTDRFSAILFYRILSKLMGFPLIMFYVELYSAIDSRQGLYYKINDYLYEKYGFDLIDGIMPISEYLVDFVRNHSPCLPLLKVPMLTDFDRFNGVTRKHKKNYFLFCGGATYHEVIAFVLESFELLDSLYDIRLFLVINGLPSDMRRVEKAIAKNKKNNSIKLFSGISNDHLTDLYANARGLLIPLRDTIQDKARFPHKLGEYIASGNPVVTTNYGEIPNYFEDEETALIAAHYDIAEFANKMEFILLNPDKAEEIGLNGRLMGTRHFDCRMHCLKIKEFLEGVIDQYVRK